MTPFLLFFLFGQVFSSGSPPPQSQTKAPMNQQSPSEAACHFLEPLGNFTLDKNASFPRGNQSSYNIPLMNSQKKLNFTVENGNQFSYILDGKQYNYEKVEMNEDERLNLCSCLTKLSEMTSSKSFIDKQANNVCGSIMCSHLIRDNEILEKKESLDAENLGPISKEENDAFEASGLKNLGIKDFLALEHGDWIQLKQETLTLMKQTPNFNRQTILSLDASGRIQLKESAKIIYKKFLAKFIAKELIEMEIVKEFVCSFSENSLKLF